MLSALQTPRPKFILTPTIFGLLYVIGIPAFVFLSLGKQHVPGFVGFEQYGFIYAALSLWGAITSFAIVLGHRWGLIGQLNVWIVTLTINIMLNRNVIPYLGWTLILVGFWAVDVYRNRQWLH
jgi:hypothetical protein